MPGTRTLMGVSDGGADGISSGSRNHPAQANLESGRNRLRAAGPLTAGEETKQHLADGGHQVALQLFEHVHVQVEGVIGLLNDAIGHGLIDRQRVHRRAIGRLERLLIGDVVEDVEAQARITLHVHRLLGNVLEDLTTGKITEVTGVVVTHQQLG